MFNKLTQNYVLQTSNTPVRAGTFSVGPATAAGGRYTQM